jgi:hypothetical protein
MTFDQKLEYFNLWFVNFLDRLCFSTAITPKCYHGLYCPFIRIFLSVLFPRFLLLYVVLHKHQDAPLVLFAQFTIAAVDSGP